MLIFWQFQNPGDFLYSVIKGMSMATAIVLVACYYGYTASGGPVGVGKATAKSMVLNLVLVNLIGMLGTEIFWGTKRARPNWRLKIGDRPVLQFRPHWLAASTTCGSAWSAVCDGHRFDTVELHMYRAMQKLGVSDRRDL